MQIRFEFLSSRLCYLGRPWGKNITKARPQLPRLNSKNILGLATFVLMNHFQWILYLMPGSTLSSGIYPSFASFTANCFKYMANHMFWPPHLHFRSLVFYYWNSEIPISCNLEVTGNKLFTTARIFAFSLHVLIRATQYEVVHRFCSPQGQGWSDSTFSKIAARSAVPMLYYFNSRKARVEGFRL